MALEEWLERVAEGRAGLSVKQRRALWHGLVRIMARALLREYSVESMAEEAGRVLDGQQVLAEKPRLPDLATSSAENRLWAPRAEVRQRLERLQEEIQGL